MADRDTDSNDDVDMGESDGPAVGNGGARTADAAAAAGGAAAKKGSRRKSSSAVVANGEVRAISCAVYMWLGRWVYLELMIRC